MKYNWGHNRRINFASNYTKKVFGGRVQKVTLDAGFTCPNRDGTISIGGCSFCNNKAFNPSYCHAENSISWQIKEGIEFHKNRYRFASKYMAYFQAYSNTYASVDVLRERYYEALNQPGIIGLVIGTRPDCVNDKVFDLLEEISKKYHLTIEFGIESIYEETLKKINRGHTYEKSVWAVNEAHRRGIKTGAHFIFGLPGETTKMMLDSAQVISQLPLHSIKFHQLQIIKDTKIGDEYQKNPNSFKLFELEEYVDFITNFLTFISPEFIVERLAGETQPDYNLASKWEIRYDQVLQIIEKKMEEIDIWQGMNYRTEENVMIE